MKRNLLTSFAFLVIIIHCTAQTASSFEKECRISGGAGISNSSSNSKSAGSNLWIQLDYVALTNFSIATEFEYMNYKLPGYYNYPQINPNEIKLYSHNFSVLIKYHIPTKTKLNFVIASGWTFSVLQNDYFIVDSYGNGTGSYLSITKNITSYNDFRIPVLGEINYPISKNINLQARFKYNFSSQNGDNYSAGIGASLKL